MVVLARPCSALTFKINRSCIFAHHNCINQLAHSPHRELVICILMSGTCSLRCWLSHICALLESQSFHQCFFKSSVGFLGNMAQLMESIPLPISLGSYVIWQRLILMMKLLSYLSNANYFVLQ